MCQQNKMHSNLSHQFLITVDKNPNLTNSCPSRKCVDFKNTLSLIYPKGLSSTMNSE